MMESRSSFPFYGFFLIIQCAIYLSYLSSSSALAYIQPEMFKATFQYKRNHAFLTPSSTTSSPRKTTELYFFDKIFEEEGLLGKGITVGKVQVALQVKDRSDTSMFGVLEDATDIDGDDQYELSKMANAVCLGLLRRSDDWIAAGSTSRWFSADDDGKAESLFNDWANREAAKFEKDYIPGGQTDKGGPTLLVVSLVVEIQGDQTKFDGAGYSLAGTKDVLSSIASDCIVDDGSCLNAVEVFWTPGEPEEVLVKNDIILDFPELIDL